MLGTTLLFARVLEKGKIAVRKIEGVIDEETEAIEEAPQKLWVPQRSEILFESLKRIASLSLRSLLRRSFFI